MDTIKAVVTEIQQKAQAIKLFELRARDGGALPPFTAGAHVDVNVPNGFTRSYSLCNSQSERDRYVIAVNLDPKSRGGSQCMHSDVRKGDVLTITSPLNNFELREDASFSCLIAGGIGITPLWCMVQRLNEIRRPWRLYYCARDAESAAFVEELEAAATSGVGSLHMHLDDVSGGKFLDVPEIVGRAGPETHFYCCGPVGLMEAFESATRALPKERVHVEYFSAVTSPARSGGFTVELAKSGLKLSIPAGSTILETILAAGVDVPNSCREGVCSTCETRVISGIPDHRDHVLSESERASNRTMMICCSGARTETLVLDL